MSSLPIVVGGASDHLRFVKQRVRSVLIPRPYQTIRQGDQRLHSL